MKAILIMGSTFDEPHAKKLTDKLDEYGIEWEQHAASAHKQPLKVLEILNNNKEEKDIVVEFDLEQTDPQYINSFLIHLQQIIDETEELGEFEYGPFKFTINKKINVANSKKIITNPKVKKEHLYTIH